MVRTSGFQPLKQSSILWCGTMYKYTQKEFDEISLLYQNGSSLEEIQSLYPGKSVASIRMKLVKAGLYNKPNDSLELYKKCMNLVGFSTY